MHKPLLLVFLFIEVYLHIHVSKNYIMSILFVRKKFSTIYYTNIFFLIHLNLPGIFFENSLLYLNISKMYIILQKMFNSRTVHAISFLFFHKSESENFQKIFRVFFKIWKKNCWNFFCRRFRQFEKKNLRNFLFFFFKLSERPAKKISKFFLLPNLFGILG